MTNKGDLISRNALKEKLKPCEDGVCEQTCKDCRFRVVTAEDIDNAPTVERPQGEWIDHENHIECNKCQVWFLKDHLIRKSFCPNCGADMRGKEK